MPRNHEATKEINEMVATDNGHGFARIRICTAYHAKQTGRQGRREKTY
ncbi:MAG: hypothetical protein PHX21_00905 [bacterium]|nr:hypothetical protein [bacterium]